MRLYRDADHHIPALAAPPVLVAGHPSAPVTLTASNVPLRVVLLGTGDPLNHERAQASLAVQCLEGAEGAERETILIDTSRGTILLGQLHAAGIALARIRHVFISHRHFDHAGGLAPLLVALSALPAATVTVYAPPITMTALHDLLAMSIPGVEEWLGPRLCWRTLVPGQAVAAGRAIVTSFAVAHGMEYVGFRVDTGGVTLTVSADTRPCPALVKYAEGADLLIHEAYGLDTVVAEAHRFGHATAADAGRAACAAGVRRLVLTHVCSSLHANPTALVDEAKSVFAGPVTLARDLDVVDVRTALNARGR